MRCPPAAALALLLSLSAVPPAPPGGAGASVPRSGPPGVLILANSIDASLADDLIRELQRYGLSVTVVGASDFPPHRRDPIVVVLGGPDAPQGIGSLVGPLLTPEERRAVRTPGSSEMFVKTGVWAPGQVVIVLAGSDRWGTQEAHRTRRDDLFSLLAPPIEITGESPLAGVVYVSSLRVPPGSTLRLTGDAMIISLGPVEVGGRIRGNCVSLVLAARGPLHLSGQIDNSCGGELGENDSGGGIYIWSEGNLTISGANFTTDGDVLVSNGLNPLNSSGSLDSNSTPQPGWGMTPPSGRGLPAWWPPNFPPPPAPPGNASAGRRGFLIVANSIFVQRDRRGCVWRGGVRSRYVLHAYDNLVLRNVMVIARDGRPGCNGSGPGRVEGGRAERGASILAYAEDPFYPLGMQDAGRLVVEDCWFVSGSGGRGGDANATGDPDALALGGDGAPGGGITLMATRELVLEGSNRFEVGDGGRGGDARAYGAPGEDGCPGKGGGKAEAVAGDGGGGAWFTLRSSGVRGPNPSVSGGSGGRGGDALASGGRGGDGTGPACDGGIGGNSRAVGGDGGAAQLANLAGMPISPGSFVGGDGGAASVISGSNGGDGGSGCGSEPAQPGGNGGPGGNVTVESGPGGSGFGGAGRPGDALINLSGNGGSGGPGSPPGSGGPAGEKSVETHGGASTVLGSFQDGPDGPQCEVGRILPGGRGREGPAPAALGSADRRAADARRLGAGPPILL